MAENLDMIALKYLRKSCKKAKFSELSGDEIMALARSFVVIDEMLEAASKPLPPIATPVVPVPVKEKKTKKKKNG